MKTHLPNDKQSRAPEGEECTYGPEALESVHPPQLAIVEQWLTGDGHAPRPANTQRVYQRAMRLWMAFLANGQFPRSEEQATALLWSVEPSNAREWQEKLMDSGKKGATVNQLLSSVSCFYKYALTHQLAPAAFHENPINSHLKRCRVDAYASARVLTAVEYRQLMSWLESQSDAISHLRAHALIRILLHTGLRASELLVMRAGDLKPAARVPGGMRYRCRLPNGDGFTDLLPSDCAAVLKYYLEKAERPLGSLAPEEYIWTPVRTVDMSGLGIAQNMAVPICRRQAMRVVQTYLRDAGIPNHDSFTLNDLRHTHGALLHESGASVDTILKRMRFSSVASTARFVRSVIGAGEVDDHSALFLALRKTSKHHR